MRALIFLAVVFVVSAALAQDGDPRQRAIAASGFLLGLAHACGSDTGSDTARNDAIADGLLTLKAAGIDENEASGMIAELDDGFGNQPPKSLPPAMCKGLWGNAMANRAAFRQKLASDAL